MEQPDPCTALDVLHTEIVNEKATHRQRLKELNVQMETIQAQICEIEDRLEQLPIIEQWLNRKRDEAPWGTAGMAPEPRIPSADPVRIDAKREERWRTESAPTPSRPELTGVNQRLLHLLADSGQAMRARQVALAMGEPDRHGRVESMRARLKRLVALGWLAEEQQGLFSVATPVNGTAPPEGGNLGVRMSPIGR